MTVKEKMKYLMTDEDYKMRIDVKIPQKTFTEINKTDINKGSEL